MADLEIVIVSSVVGGAVAFVGALLKNLVDARTKIDQDLRERRTPVYTELWVKTRLLPKYPIEEVTYGQLRGLSEELREWYFHKGGMYLSRRSEKRYHEVQKALEPYVKATTQQNERELISGKIYESIRSRCSILRDAMADDLLSRRPRSRLFG